jgi:hypothetical protein
MHNLTAMKSALYSIVIRCSVADSHRDVLTYAISRLKPSYWQAQPLSFRVQFARACRDLHEENRALYRNVMRGMI